MKPDRTITVRRAQTNDAVQLTSLLNEIIDIGGTTAYQKPLTISEFEESFLKGSDYICCFVAIDSHGSAAGFQALEYRPRLPDNWGDIATFARVSPKIAGIGTALFAHTLACAKDLGLAAINATIRADNAGGLAFYEKMGFRTYEVIEAIPLDDGTTVDRISKKLLLLPMPPG